MYALLLRFTTGSKPGTQCQLIPAITSNEVLFNARTNTTTILRSRNIATPPADLTYTILEHLLYAINVIGQTENNNLVAESIVSIDTAYYQGNHSHEADIWAAFLRGMFEFVCTRKPVGLPLTLLVGCDTRTPSVRSSGSINVAQRSLCIPRSRRDFSVLYNWLESELDHCAISSVLRGRCVLHD